MLRSVPWLLVGLGLAACRAPRSASRPVMPSTLAPSAVRVLAPIAETPELPTPGPRRLVKKDALLPVRWSSPTPGLRSWLGHALAGDEDLGLRMDPIQLPPQLHEEPAAQVAVADDMRLGFGVCEEWTEPVPFLAGFDHERYSFSDSLVTITWALDLSPMSSMIGTLAAHHVEEDTYTTTVLDPEFAWAAIGFRFRF